VEISSNGRFLFTVNTAVSTVSRYAIAGDGTLLLLGSTPFAGAGAGAAGIGPEDARLTPQGTTLWVVDSKAAQLSAFGVHGGDLTPLAAATTRVRPVRDRHRLVRLWAAGFRKGSAASPFVQESPG
jgi:6-phosphogluconolactonase (cycloisomerase 2 family)